MSSSLESTFESKPKPDPDPRLELSLIDLEKVAQEKVDQEKTVIRQGGLLHSIRSDRSEDRPFSLVGFRQSASQLLDQQLDHFLIESLVGTGGMGAVFRGRDTKLNREVAIKVVPMADRDAEAMRRFRVEAQSAAKLDHPNIARVYYVGETEHWSYIVFEFVEGTNLRELVVKKGLLSIDDAVCLTRQVAEALQHAFERKVVHRDVKPSNILVTQSGQAKLVDMGLARTTELDKSTNDLTASGVTLGTFDYISPEQAHDPRQADVRSDIYSLGCTLYYLLTGQPPFPEGTAIQKLLLHGTKMPEDPRLFRSDISDSMIAILRKMLAKRPSDRYQEPADLIRDLRTLAELEGLEWASSSENISSLPAAAERTWLEASLPLLISLAAITGATLWLQSSTYLSATFPIPRVDYREAGSTSSDTNTGLPKSDNLASGHDPESLSEPTTNSPAASLAPSSPDLSNKIKTPEDATDRTTIIVDSEVSNDRDRNAFIVRSLDQALVMVANQSQINRIVIASSSVSSSATASVVSLKSTISLRSNLTIQSDSGQRYQLVIDGSESLAEPITSLAWFECVSNQLVLQDLDIFWKVSSMSRRRSLFSVRSNSQLQLKNCSVTVQYEPNPYSSTAMDTTLGLQGTALPSVIVLDPGLQDNFGESSSSSMPKLPAKISCNQMSVRGQCDWLRMPSPIRTEVNMGNCWLAIAGSMFEMNGGRTAVRVGMPLRMDFKNVTAYTQRAWMRATFSDTQPFPIPMVRTAHDCVFAGSKSHIEWNATECDDWQVWDQSDEGNEISKWIDLRGRDNVFDSLSIADYLTIKLSNGSLERIELGSDANLVGEERGLETVSSWSKRPVLEPSRMHEVTFEALEWNPNSFHPGFQSHLD